jgi:hypothetical protein
MLCRFEVTGEAMKITLTLLALTTMIIAACERPLESPDEVFDHTQRCQLTFSPATVSCDNAEVKLALDRAAFDRYATNSIDSDAAEACVLAVPCSSADELESAGPAIVQCTQADDGFKLPGIVTDLDCRRACREANECACELAAVESCLDGIDACIADCR